MASVTCANIVPDPTIEKPTDAIVRVTFSGICGSDLHLW
jgi:threonine dehydrogenase-like Zn-dependent dehydrogenase